MFCLFVFPDCESILILILLAQPSYPDPLDVWNFIALQKNTPKPEYDECLLFFLIVYCSFVYFFFWLIICSLSFSLLSCSSVKFGNPENLIGWSDSNRDQGARAFQGGLTRVKDIVAKTQGLSKKNAETKLETV
jgi:hypothetical protein